nr:methylenetetrahydrofolate reductase [Rhizobiaceae bacterium]
GSTRAEVVEFAEELWNNGIRRLVALRGDARGAGQEEAFGSTADFVRALKSVHPFEIAVSCYPEVHPLAQSREEDIAVLKAKQDAGATLAISQFFFDNSAFYEFVAEARKAGVTIPIVPGILPIYNFKRVQEMAEQCGAHIPDFVIAAFDKANTCGTDDLEVASELLKAQVHDLAVAGFEQIHIYTLNRSHLAGKAAEAFLQAHLERSAPTKKVA